MSRGPIRVSFHFSVSGDRFGNSRVPLTPVLVPTLGVEMGSLFDFPMYDIPHSPSVLSLNVSLLGRAVICLFVPLLLSPDVLHLRPSPYGSQ